MNFCLQLAVLDESDLIAAHLDQWSHRNIDHIVVLLCKKLWRQINGDFERPVCHVNNDLTKDIIHSYFPHVEIVEQEWATEAETRNWGLAYAYSKKFDYVIVNDPDEFYTDSSWNGVMANVWPNDYNKTNIMGYTIPMKTYFWNLSTRIIESDDPWRPPIVVKSELPKGFIARYPALGVNNFQCVERSTMYHLSWIGPRLRLQNKATKSGHWSDWTEEWRQWIISDNPPSTQPIWKLCHDPVPDEIAQRVVSWQKKLGLPVVEVS